MYRLLFILLLCLGFSSYGQIEGSYISYLITSSDWGKYQFNMDGTYSYMFNVLDRYYYKTGTYTIVEGKKLSGLIKRDTIVLNSSVTHFDEYCLNYKFFKKDSDSFTFYIYPPNSLSRRANKITFDVFVNDTLVNIDTTVLPPIIVKYPIGMVKSISLRIPSSSSNMKDTILYNAEDITKTFISTPIYYSAPPYDTICTRKYIIKRKGKYIKQCGMPHCYYWKTEE